MRLLPRAKSLLASGTLAVAALGSLAVAAPAHASTIQPGPRWFDPYSISLITGNGCQGPVVIAQGLPAFNYQSGSYAGWVELWRVGPDGTEVDSGGAREYSPPNGNVYWGDPSKHLTPGEYVAVVEDNDGNYWPSNDIFC